jgi:hypothetical protein
MYKAQGMWGLWRESLKDCEGSEKEMLEEWEGFVKEGK